MVKRLLFEFKEEIKVRRTETIIDMIYKLKENSEGVTLK